MFAGIKELFFPSEKVKSQLLKSISGLDVVEKVQFEIAKEYLERDLVKNVVTAILCNDSTSFKICSFESESITSLSLASRVLEHIKVGQQALSRVFSDNPQVLFRIFQRQLLELNTLFSGHHFQRILNIDNGARALFESKIHRLVSKTYSLVRQMGLDWRRVSIPQEVVSEFPELAFAPIESQIASRIVQFLEPQQRVRIFALLDGWNKWELFSRCKESYSSFWVDEITTPSPFIVGNCTYLNIDQLVQSTWFKKTYKGNFIEFQKSVGKFTSLKEIDAGSSFDSKLMSDVVLPSINSHLRGLAINFRGSAVTDIDFYFMNSQILTVDLSNTKIKGSCLRAESLKSLTSLHLRQCGDFDEKNLEQPLCLSVQIFELTKNSQFTGECFYSDFFKPIQELILDECPRLAEEFLKTLSCRSLNKLNLNFVSLEGSSLSQAVFQHLLSLSMQGNKDLADTSLLKLSSTKLEHLNLSNTFIAGEFVLGNQFRSLKELILRGCLNLNQKYFENYAPTDLKILDLSENSITSEWLTYKMFSNISHLYLQDCPNLTDGAFNSIVFPKLKVLDLSGTKKITGSCFSSDFFQCVEELNLDYSDIDPKNLLHFSGKKLIKLSMRGTNITSDILYGSLFRKLEVLDLRGCSKLTFDLIPDELKNRVIL